MYFDNPPGSLLVSAMATSTNIDLLKPTIIDMLLTPRPVTH